MFSNYFWDIHLKIDPTAKEKLQKVDVIDGARCVSRWEKKEAKV